MAQSGCRASEWGSEGRELRILSPRHEKPSVATSYGRLSLCADRYLSPWCVAGAAHPSILRQIVRVRWTARYRPRESRWCVRRRTGPNPDPAHGGRQRGCKSSKQGLLCPTACQTAFGARARGWRQKPGPASWKEDVCIGHSASHGLHQGHPAESVTADCSGRSSDRRDVGRGDQQGPQSKRPAFGTLRERTAMLLRMLLRGKFDYRRPRVRIDFPLRVPRPLTSPEKLR